MHGQQKSSLLRTVILDGPFGYDFPIAADSNDANRGAWAQSWKAGAADSAERAGTDGNKYQRVSNMAAVPRTVGAEALR